MTAGSAGQDDAHIVVESARDALSQYYGDLIIVHEIWADTPHSACIVYESRRDNSIGPLGQRITFPPHAVADDPASTGRDWADDIAEPLGTLLCHLRYDDLGIGWTGVLPDQVFPTPPHWRPGRSSGGGS